MREKLRNWLGCLLGHDYKLIDYDWRAMRSKCSKCGRTESLK